MPEHSGQVSAGRMITCRDKKAAERLEDPKDKVTAGQTREADLWLRAAEGLRLYSRMPVRTSGQIRVDQVTGMLQSWPTDGLRPLSLSICIVDRGAALREEDADPYSCQHCIRVLVGVLLSVRGSALLPVPDPYQTRAHTRKSGVARMKYQTCSRLCHPVGLSTRARAKAKARASVRVYLYEPANQKGGRQPHSYARAR